MDKTFLNIPTSLKLVIAAFIMMVIPLGMNGQQNLNTDMYLYRLGKQHYLISKENAYAAYEICAPDWYCPYEYAAYDRSLGICLIDGLPDLIGVIDESIANGSVKNDAEETLEYIDQVGKAIENYPLGAHETSIMTEQQYQEYLAGLPAVLESIQELKDRIKAFIESATDAYGDMWKIEDKGISKKEIGEFPLYLTYLMSTGQSVASGLSQFSWDTDTWNDAWSIPRIGMRLKGDIGLLQSVACGMRDIRNIRISDYQSRIEGFRDDFESSENKFREIEADGTLSQWQCVRFMESAYKSYEQLSQYGEWIIAESDFVTAYTERPQEVLEVCLGFLDYLEDYAANYVEDYRNYRNHINDIITTLGSFPRDMASMLGSQDNTFIIPENVVDENGNSYEVRRIMRALPYYLEYDSDITVILPRTVTAVMRPENSADVIFGGFKNISKIISYNPIPPVLEMPERWNDGLSFSDFSESVYKEATLVVPDESLDKYKDERTTWHYFNHVETLSGVKETLDIDDADCYEVYSVDGYRIGRFADKGDLQNLKPGLYIVRHGSSSERHFVR